MLSGKKEMDHMFSSTFGSAFDAAAAASVAFDSSAGLLNTVDRLNL
jgi:hypothetical protein